MPKETMSPRERWQAAMRRQKQDRVPMDLWATPEAMQRVAEYMGCNLEAIVARLHIDQPMVLSGHYVGPPKRPHTDIWGIKYKNVNYGAGVYGEAVNTPLARFSTVDEVEAHYTWPKADWFDMSDLPALVARNMHRPIQAGGSEPFLVYKMLRGDEQAMLDLLENPELVHHCLDRMFDFYYELTQRFFETVPGAITHVYVAEDLGGQDNLMYSQAQIREFFLPGMKRMADLVKAQGAVVVTHTDGAVREVLDDLIGIGVQMLNPIQWRCRGMDRQALKHDFGDRLAFHGGVDNQQTLPFGSPADVRAEVIENLRIFGESGGYILAPCHNIQVVSPPENVIALYETGYEEGWL